MDGILAQGVMVSYMNIVISACVTSIAVGRIWPSIRLISIVFSVSFNDDNLFKNFCAGDLN